MRVKITPAFAFALALPLIMGGCANLTSEKSVPRHAGNLSSQSLTVVDGERLLSPAEVEKVLDPVLSMAPSGEKLHRLLLATEQISGNPLILNNEISLLVDADQTYQAIFSAIENAQKHIHIISYIFAEDEVGNELALLLKKKAAEGIEVRLIVDAIGGLFVSESFYADLRESGIQTQKFNPIDPLESPKLWRINHREHSKLIIVDGQTVFTGGMNISGVYEKSSSRLYSLSLPEPSDIIQDRAWRDTHVRIIGPSNAYFQDRFIQAWNKLSDNKLEDLVKYAPEPAEHQRGTAILRVLESDGADNEYEIYQLYLSAIRQAQARLWLTHAYFAPNQELLDALKDAARRGVDVHIILPGVLDQGPVYHSSRSRYGELLKAGVKICNFKDRMLHAKTMVVDSLWATVGSANLDFRSFIHNNELNISVLDRNFANVMERQFKKDLMACESVTLEAWQQRPFTDKVKEILSRTIDYWL